MIDKDKILLDVLECKEEQDLYRELLSTKDLLNSYNKSKDFSNCIKVLDNLSVYLNKFLDDVMVNIEDSVIRENRLNLLQEVINTYNLLVDFDKIEV